MEFIMTEEIPTTRKERERFFRKQEILNAAKKIFAHKGFANTTLDEIAESSEFGKGTLYNYFQRKEDIYESIVMEVANRIVTAAKTADQETTDYDAFIRSFVTKIFMDGYQDPDGFRVYVREISGLSFETIDINREVFYNTKMEFFQILMERFKPGYETGALRRNISLDENIAYFIHLVFPYLQYSISCPHSSASLAEKTELVLSVIHNGFLIN